MDLSLQSAFLAEMSTLLILLAGAVLLYSSFREKYLVPWIAGWSVFTLSKVFVALSLAGSHALLWTALANSFYVVAVGLFATAVFFYVSEQALIWPAFGALTVAIPLELASVRDAGEAETAMTAGADIIDLKDPQSGALGALDLKTIASCVRSIARRAPVSATVGDLPLDGETIRDAVLATAASGVDYVKLGLFPGGDARACLRLLEAERSRVHLILVLFADALPDFDAVGEAARIGAAGVMLDTAGKSGGSLLDHLSLDTLARFVAAAKGEGLTVGLAGSLKANHVPQLLGLGPDQAARYLNDEIARWGPLVQASGVQTQQ